MKIPIHNTSAASLGIRLEPWCDELELGPGKEGEVEFDLADDDTLGIDFHDENFISLWVPPGATLKAKSE